MPYYLQPVNVGIKDVSTLGDGKSMRVSWHKAFTSNSSNKIAYNIYFSESFETLFSEGAKFIVSTDDTSLNITDLFPGQMYYFSVRPVEYNPLLDDLSTLPSAGYAPYYPESVLSSSISKTSLSIPLVDASDFPSSGFIKIGSEIIQYSSKTLNSLILTSLSQRGFYNSIVRSHDVDGYDGYIHQNPAIRYYVAGESTFFDRVYKNQSRFEYGNYAYTQEDGYKQVTKDILTTDLSASDLENKDFPSFDYRGYRRTDPVLLLNGTCVGSYIGGEQYCVDGYSGVGRSLRGFSLQEKNNQNQEQLLEIDGETTILLIRDRVGVRCQCFTLNRESALSRCEYCFGTGFVVGYQQFFNPRRSDGRILVRYSPVDEDIKLNDSGYESEFNTDGWTLTYPTIKDRDILIRYDIDGNEEFRYEVLSVTRNKLLNGQQGAQKFKLQRVRKTDPVYQIDVFKDSSMYPRKVLLESGGNAAVPAHTHEIVLSEKVTNINQVNQITSMTLGHTHIIKNGLIVGIGSGSSLQHTHIVKLV